MNKEQEALLLQIQALDFTLLDLILYLDVHPDDMNAMEYYRVCLAELELLMCDYERQYGPITTKGCGLDNEQWKWATCPWPWDNKCGGKCHVEL